MVLDERLGLLGLAGSALILAAVAGLESDDEGAGGLPEGPAPL